MSTGNNESERVSQYLDGDLNHQQTQAFEAELKDNHFLQEELRLQQKAEKLILEHFEKERQKKMWASYKEFTKEADKVTIQPEQKVQKTNWVRRLSVAATIIAALSFMFMIIMMPTTDNILQFGMENTHLVEVERTLNTPTETPITQLEKEVNDNPTLIKKLELSDLYLKTKEYSKAQTLLEQMQSTTQRNHPKYYDIQWALANTYLATKQYDKAIQHYQEVIDNNGLNEEKINTAKKYLRILKIKRKLGLL